MCERREALLAMLESRLRMTRVTPPYARVVAVRVERTPDRGYAVAVALRDLEGRVLDRDRGAYPEIACFEVLYYAAFIASVLIEPRPPVCVCGEGQAPVCPAPVVVEPAKEVVEAPKAAPVAPARPQTEAVRGRPSRSPERARLEVAVAQHVAFGLAPAPVVSAIAVGAGVRWARWSVGGEARVTLPAQGAPGGATVFQVVTGAVAAVPCAHIGLVALCGVGTIGGAWASPERRPYRVGDGAFFAGLGARARFEQALGGRFALRIEAEGMGLPRRAPITTGLGAVLWHMPPVVGSVGVGVAAWF